MPQSAANQEPSGPLAWLIYPGSRVLLHVANDEGSRLLQLISFDRIDQVIDWYISKFSPSKQIGLPDGGVILKGSFTTALILPCEQHITVTRQAKRAGVRTGALRSLEVAAPTVVSLYSTVCLTARPGAIRPPPVYFEKFN